MAQSPGGFPPASNDPKRIAELRLAINDALAGPDARIGALRRSLELGALQRPADAPGLGEVNNHIHTIYSFSPYSPAMAAVRAFEEGLEVAGSVDHDSIAAADEMSRACSLLGIGCVTGSEIRVTFTATSLSGFDFASRKINNPDSVGKIYMTIQGIPEGSRADMAAFLAPIRAQRRQRTEAMLAQANRILQDAGLPSIAMATVAALSREDEGGGITERHLCYAVAGRLARHYGAGQALVRGLREDLGLEVPAKAASLLGNPDNPILLYDLVNLLKTDFLSRIFLQPTDEECIPVALAVEFARSIGAVPAYAYLGDVGDSPTGDKKAEKFEDDYLEELFVELERIGFLAVTYMPPRNTKEQLLRVRSLCERHGFMEISGVDINQPRQSFTCHELRMPEFSHLVDTTWALVAHEKLASADPSLGLFSPGPQASLSLGERLALYARAGRAIDPATPDSVATIAARLREGRLP
jgi:hypothetical protein